MDDQRWGPDTAAAERRRARLAERDRWEADTARDGGPIVAAALAVIQQWRAMGADPGRDLCHALIGQFPDLGAALAALARAADDEQRITGLIEASSLGTPEARRLRARTSPQAAAAVVDLSQRLGERVELPREPRAGHVIDAAGNRWTRTGNARPWRGGGGVDKTWGELLEDFGPVTIGGDRDA